MNTSISAGTKRKGRPKTTGKGQQIGVRLLPPNLSALDTWIARQPEPRPSRPEAIRRILADALGGADAGFIAAEDLNASNDE